MKKKKKKVMMIEEEEEIWRVMEVKVERHRVVKANKVMKSTMGSVGFMSCRLGRCKVGWYKVGWYVVAQYMV